MVCGLDLVSSYVTTAVLLQNLELNGTVLPVNRTSFEESFELQTSSQYYGSHISSGYQAMFTDQLRTGVIEIKLPKALLEERLDFKYNETNQTDWISLQKRIFRLELTFPSEVNVYITEVDAHSAITSLRLTTPNEYNGDFNKTVFYYNDGRVYEDFTIDPDNVTIEDNLTISIQIDWSWSVDDPAALFTFSTHAELFIYNEFTVQLQANDSLSSLVNETGYPYVHMIGSGDLYYNLSMMVDGELPRDCMFVDENNTLIDSWDDIQNCTRCIRLIPKSLSTSTALSQVLQAGSRLTCDHLNETKINLLEFEFVREIKHDPYYPYSYNITAIGDMTIQLEMSAIWSHTERLDLVVTLPDGTQNTYSTTYDPTINVTQDYQSIANITSLPQTDSGIMIWGRIKYSNTIPVGTGVPMEFTLTYPVLRANSDVQKGFHSCYVYFAVDDYIHTWIDNFPVTNIWNVLDTAEIQVTITLPPGSMYQTVIELEINESGGSTSPVVIQPSPVLVEVDPNVKLLDLNVSTYSIPTLTFSSMGTDPLRRTAKIYLGDVRNTGSNTGTIIVKIPLVASLLVDAETHANLSAKINTSRGKRALGAASVSVPYNATASNIDILSIPTPEWTILEEAEIGLNIIMSAGTITNCIMTLNDNSSVAELVRSNVIVSHSNLTLSSSLTRNFLSRKKRAATAHTVNFGSITNTGATGTVNFKIIFRAAGSAPLNTAVTLSATFSSSSVSAASPVLTTTLVGPQLQIVKYYKHYNNDLAVLDVYFNITHTTASTRPAYNVQVDVSESGFTFNSDPTTSISSSINVNTDSTATITVDTLQTNKQFTISYRSSPVDESIFKSRYFSLTYLYYSVNKSSSSVVTLDTISCIERDEIIVQARDTLFYGGMIFLAILLGFICGLVLLAVIIFFIRKHLVKTRRIAVAGDVYYQATDYGAMAKQRQSRALLLDTDQKYKEEKIILISARESIISLLISEDKFKVNREMDSIDVQTTLVMDKKMEEERQHATKFAMEALLKSLTKQGNLSPDEFKMIWVLFEKELKARDGKLIDDNKKALEEFVKTQALHNRAKLGQLIDKQATDKEKRLNKAGDVSDEERRKLESLIDKECQAEQDNVAYLLKLEQDEKAEYFRKEHVLKKRMQTREIQMGVLNMVKDKNMLPAEQAEWLIEEYHKTVAHIDQIHDDEICRQKLVLEERLANRKALTKLSDVKEDQTSELFNSLAGDQVDCIKRAKKLKIINPSEAKSYNDQLLGELKIYNDDMKTDITKQEDLLLKKLNAQRRQKLEAKEKEQKVALEKFTVYARKALETGTVDPMSLSNERLEFVSKQEIEMAAVEESLDKEHAEALGNLRDELTNNYRNKLAGKEEKLLTELKKDGLRDEQIAAIMREHQSNVETLEEHQAALLKQQQESLKAKLKKRRKDLESRMETEKQEKAHLREQVQEVTSHLVHNQMSMSDEERDRIMKEHEGNLIRLENSLTMNKLRQRQMLEKRLNEKRAKRVENMEKQHLTDLRKQTKKSIADGEDEHTVVIDILTEQAAERLEMITEDDLEVNLDEELEKVKLDMMNQRAVALREQEDRLGGMVAQLQFAKAKEVAEIEEKQKAINELKTSLMEDLTSRGVMSDSEAEQHLELHRQQQDKLVTKLENEKSKQEKVLKSKLAARLESREKTLIETHESRLQEILAQTPNRLAQKLKKAVQNHRRMVAIEEFKTNMEKEISQSLEEMRRQHEIKKRKFQQELELRFIASLVQQGKLKRDVLKDSLKMLFPGKTDKELEQIINTLHDNNTEVTEDENELLNGHSASMLRERIAVSMNLIQGNNMGTINEGQEMNNQKRRKPSHLDPVLPDYPIEPPRSKLPPLEASPAAGRKKKKRKTRPNYDEETGDYF